MIPREAWLGYGVLGASAGRRPRGGAQRPACRSVGNAGDAPGHRDRVVTLDVVFFAGGARVGQPREAARSSGTSSARREGCWSRPASPTSRASASRVRPTGGLPLMHIEPPRWIKACHAGGSGPSTWPVRPCFALCCCCRCCAFLPRCGQALRRSRGGCCSARPGWGATGGEFSCLKFRTMVVDAEDL